MRLLVQLSVLLSVLIASTVPAQDQSRRRITAEMQRGVDDGLKYLADTQHVEGHWIQDVGFKLNTNYTITAPHAAHVGVTSLALISFLAGGHLPGRGKYGKNIERGLRYVLSRVTDNGYIRDNGSRMYSHAFATLFLAEIYGMTHRSDVRRSLQKAVNIIVDSQNAEGGWRYRPFARESDMSITVCQVLALRSARNVGISVSAITVKDAERYVRRSAVREGDINRRHGRRLSYLNDGGAFRYQLRQGSRTTFPLTAAGITTLHAAGIYDDPIIDDAFEFLEEQMRGFNSSFGERGHYFFYYGHYYAVQAYYTAGGPKWIPYYHRITKTLLRSQNSDGSWPCDVGPGKVFATAVATLILQIPYQYLPIFQR